MKILRILHGSIETNQRISKGLNNNYTKRTNIVCLRVSTLDVALLIGGLLDYPQVYDY
jgi:hypothetical protein